MDISQLLKFAVEKRASDLLLTVGSPPALRIDGDLIFTSVDNLTPEGTKGMLYSVLENTQIARFEEKKELDFSLYVSTDLRESGSSDTSSQISQQMGVKRSYRFRGNAYLQRGGVAAAFRLIPDEIPSLEELSLPPIARELALAHQGLVLITGPTGHGKSTTQAAMIDVINSERKVHIITIEDPIEFVHRNNKSIIDQREVGEDTLSFAEALKHVLRQDPDVILIGEMRDLETIAAALTAAETGHLVVATLHTNDAVQTVDRLLDVFPPHQQGQIRAQLAMSLLAVVAQRLLPRSDGKGRIVATEIMRNTPATANLIREGKTHSIYSVMETHAKDGMCTMDASIKKLYMRGVISYEVAKRRMRDPNALGSR